MNEPIGIIGPSFCSNRPSDGKWVCSEGNGYYGQWFFGEPPIGAGELVDPIPPSLDGPITIHLDWTINDGAEIPAPESSMMFVNDLTFSYVFEPIPEPSTGILVMTGLLGLAYQQRRHGRAA